MPELGLQAAKLALIANRLRGPGGALEYWQSDPVAIIGMACRFPGGAHTPESFWTLLAEGREGIVEVPPSRWDVNAYYHPDPEAPGRIATRWGGFLDGIDQFDAPFFGISPREAALMDPQQRVLLEVLWEALENAGQRADLLAGSPTGVFAGVCGSDYGFLQNLDPDRLSVYSGTGTANNIVAGRAAYLFDLRGPAVALDTACSSSLAAVHLACQSLRSGDCTLAVAAGVNLILAPPASIGMSRMRMLAPDGRCKTFDARADGFVRSEGCGVVVLKRLADALAAGDPVLAAIRGSALNQDGRSTGLTAPNMLAQQAVLRQALANAGIHPAQVDYVETHGTGTVLGDPIEVEALAAVYGQPAARPCVLGAVKTNIGHAEAAAGVAGLIKAVLALQHEAIPGNLHFERVNPNLLLEGTRLETARGLRPWPRGEQPRYAAVSSFGWSGTNVHLLLEEAPAPPAAAEPRDSYLLPVSARSPEALREMAVRYAGWLGQEALPDVCYTAGSRRTHHRYRVAVAGRTAAEIAAELARVEPGEPAEGPGVVFVYPGQGGQWPGMGSELYQSEPVFRQALEECAAAIGAEAGWDLLETIRGRADWEQIDRVQPALFALEVALTALWRHWGVESALVVGHSLGEVAAAHVAGALGLTDAVQLICRRSRLLKRLRGRGAMALVELSRREVEAALAGCAGRVSVAAVNSARSTVVSGETAAVAALLRAWESQGVYCRPVAVDVASHCAQVEELQADMEAELCELRPRPAALRMESTVSASRLKGEELTAGYWVRNLRQPVRFAEVMANLVGEGYRTFVELGPHPVLVDAMAEALRREPAVAVGSLRRGEPERMAMLRSVGALYGAGAAVDWGRVNGERGRCAALPGYAWQHERYWLEEGGTRTSRRDGPVCVAGEHVLEVWDLPAVEGHRVLGREVMPAAEYLRVALEAARGALGDAAWGLQDVEFSSLLEPGREAQLVIEEDGEGGRFRVHSRAAGEPRWQRHAAGRVVRSGATQAGRVDLDAVRGRCRRRVSQDEFYQRLARQGVEYGPAFRQVREAWLGDAETLAGILSPHLDACLQGLSWAGGWGEEDVRVPVRVARVALAGGWGSEPRDGLWAWARWRDGAGWVSVTDGHGRVVAEVDGVELTPLPAPQDEWLWEVRWEPAEPAASGRADGRWLIVGAGEELASLLRGRGAECVVVLPEAASQAFSGTVEWTGVVWLAPAAEVGLEHAVATVQALAGRGWRDAPRLWLVTRGTQAARSRVQSFYGAELWGLGRTLTYEHPEFRCTLVDLAAGTEELAREITADAADDQVALRTEGRYVARLRPIGHDDDIPEPGMPAGERPFQLQIDRPGLLERLAWQATERRAPGPGEVEVEVAAAGLNFHDVLTALGEYPGQAPGRTRLGREFAGTITAVGEGVRHFRVGDTVAGCAAGSLATHVTVPAATVVRRPPGMDCDIAAGQVVAFATASYSLVELARLRPGERVLIHSAASGTGLAALEIAQWLGAEVWATAGTERKREYLRRRGVPHVLDSRGNGFARQVLEDTGGQGVDVVVNSLAGDAMRHSLQAAARFGRFVELGKRDLWGSETLATAPFRKNLSYHAVDMAALIAERPEEFHRLLEAAFHHLEAGDWNPLAVEFVEIGQVQEAFHRMAEGQHLGKLVVRMAGAAAARIGRARQLSAEATYLITGGLGGLGLPIARRLVEGGARHLALAGRHAPDAAQRETIDGLRALGADVLVCQADVADPEQVTRLIADLGPSLRGVIHASAVLDDRTLAKLDPESIARVWKPKVDGAWNLHRATLGQALDFFVIMSSVASVMGSPGQANYAAASARVDALADWRRSQGLPCLSINWGPWGGVGLAAASEQRGARLAERGMASLTPSRGLDILEQLMWRERGHAVVMRLDLRQWRQYYPRAATALLSGLEGKTNIGPAASSELRSALQTAAPALRRGMLEDHVKQQMARVLRLKTANIPDRTPFRSLGLDSLVAIEFRNRLELTLGLRLPATLVWANPTIPALVEHLAASMGLPLEDEAPTVWDGEASRIAALSEEAAEAELIAKLKEL